MPQQPDIMLDIETLGLEPGATVLSVGAVAFRRDGTILSTFESNISVESSVEHGLTADPKTAKWWAQQGTEARAEAFTGSDSLYAEAVLFARWFQSIEPAYCWAQGDMDYRVWGHAMRAAGTPEPWEFRQLRDTRTAYDVLGFDKHSFEETRQGVAHNALDDAKHQVRALCAAIVDGRRTPPLPNPADLDEMARWLDENFPDDGSAQCDLELWARKIREARAGAAS